MAKKIEFDYNGEHYILGYTKNTVRQLESTGFVLEDVPSRPLTLIPQLFAGAFLCHHRRIKDETVNEIYKHMGNRQLLLETLSEMFRNPAVELLEDPEDDGKNIEWGQIG